MTPELPSEWRLVRVGEVLIAAQYGLSLAMGAEGRYPILRMNAIQDGVAAEAEPKFVDLPDPVASQYLLTPGDVLFNRTNSAEWVGKVGLYRGDEGAVFASYLIRLIPDTEQVERSFLGRLLSSAPIQARVRRFATPGVQQVNINATNLRRVQIPLPPLEEQRAIVRVLELVDATIEQTRHALNNAQRIKQGLLQEFMCRGVGKVRSADSPSIKLAKGWRIAPTGKLLAKDPKNGLSPQTEAQPPGIITFSIAAVRGGSIDLMNREHWKYARISDEKAMPYRLKRGDILIVRGNANPALVGKCGMVDQFPEGCIYPDILKRVEFAERPDGVIPEYIRIAWNHPLVHNQVLKRAKTSNGTLKINNRDVQQIVIPVPPQTEQHRIVSLVQGAQALEQSLIESEARLIRLKRGLMQVLLTGKVRVPFPDGSPP